MIIEKIKIQTGSYLVNDTVSVPIDTDNSVCIEVQKWLADNSAVPEFTPQELTVMQQEEINREARAYLAETDWYVIRFWDRDIVIPIDIVTKRLAAVNSIDP